MARELKVIENWHRQKRIISWERLEENMKAIDVYKTRIIEIIDEAKLDGIQIDAYEKKFEDDNELFELGIRISDGKDIVHIPTWKDESIEIVE